MDRFRLDGKVALVTGAGRGLGEAVARGFAEAGADVAVVSRTTAEIEATAERVRALGRRAIAITADLGSLGPVPALVERILAEYGRIDILANIAGVTKRQNIVDVTLADWDYVINPNLRGVFFLSQAVAKTMIGRGGGCLINIASMNSYRGMAGSTVYGMSKAAIVQMTRAMAVEWTDHNIRVNAIAPGWIDTPMVSTMPESRKQWVLEHTPQHRMGTPEDIAAMAIFLASPAANFITGHTYAVDGGFLAGQPWPALPVT